MLQTTTRNIGPDVYLSIATQAYGENIANALYDFYNAINSAYYDSRLPFPIITFEIMPYGACIGMTNSTRGHIRLKKYATGISINESVVGVLLHETIHFARPYVEEEVLKDNPLADLKSFDKTSHNHPYWISEINRIHFQTTGEHLNAGLQIMKRTGESKKPKRIDLGNIKRSQISCYPHSSDICRKYVDYLQSIMDRKYL